ncbi:MAG: hypothetical protein LLF96_03155 [Eubacteriales bacterium]|nr:hypothetical protein [Eubacteriales bacterium]
MVQLQANRSDETGVVKTYVIYAGSPKDVLIEIIAATAAALNQYAKANRLKPEMLAYAVAKYIPRMIYQKEIEGSSIDDLFRRAMETSGKPNARG